MFNALKSNSMKELTVDEMRLTDGGMIIFPLGSEAIELILKIFQ